MADSTGAAPPPQQQQPNAVQRILGGNRRWLIAAALVHVFTASGIVCGLLATLAALDGAYERVFLWLGVALLIDGIDGTFARMVDVSRRLPRFSGERLDLVIDYVTYVFVPAVALLKAGILSGGTGVALAALILMSSLYHFADTASKTEDHCFVGFPAIWNVVALYLFAFPLPSSAVVAIVLLCAGWTFVPWRWLHPMRVERLFWANMAMTVLWFVGALVTIWRGFPAEGWAAWTLLLSGAYMLVLTLVWPSATGSSSAVN